MTEPDSGLACQQVAPEPCRGQALSQRLSHGGAAWQPSGPTLAVNGATATMG